jgi:hypothetical protein
MTYIDDNQVIQLIVQTSNFMTDQNSEPFAVILALVIFSLHDDISNLFLCGQNFLPKGQLKFLNSKMKCFLGVQSPEVREKIIKYHKILISGSSE